MKIKILLFHRVFPHRDRLWDPLSPERFEEVIKFCLKQFNVVLLEDFILNKPTPPKNGKKICAICFDDGYKDFLNYALPILKKYKAPSSMYIVTDCANTGLPPWTYILDFLFQYTTLNKNIQADKLPEFLKTNQWNNSEERLSYAGKLKPYMKSLSNGQRVEILNSYISCFSDVEIPKNLMMTWDEIREIQAEGVHIGSHSHTHPLLGKLESETKIRYELSESFQQLKNNTAVRPVTISYPIGSYNETVKKISGEIGYRIGLAVNQREYDSKKDGIYEIPRIELYNEPLLKSRFRINGAIAWVNSIMRQ
jgi:peptidoglycan/xylan/chitin deacetylase (PgdA/CDA1 family)